MAFKPRRSDVLNLLSAAQYVDRLLDLALSRFEWTGLPPTVSARYLEMILVTRGRAVFFRDEVLGYLALACNGSGRLDVYNNLIRREAYASNGYRRELWPTDSVVIYNNYSRTNCVLDIRAYAERLYQLDRIIDVNVSQQRTPRIIATTERQALSVKNLLNQIEQNTPAVLMDKSYDLDQLRSIDITSPYVADKLFALKRRIWAEAMTFLGLTANVDEKQERQIVQEVDNYNQSTYAQRFTALAAREDAAREINAMFPDLNIGVRFRAAIETAGRPAMEMAAERRRGLETDELTPGGDGIE